MKKKASGISILLAAVAVAFIVLYPGTRQSDKEAKIPATLSPPFLETAFGVEEDPFARARYEHMLLADPATGEIPDGIKTKALRFSQLLPTSGQYRQMGLARTKERTYIPRGPFNVGGRTRALAMDRSNESTFIAGGVSGGVWRTTNAGTSWTRTTPPDMINSVSHLIQDTRPGRTNTWYFGTGEYSLFNSARGNNSTPYRGDGVFKSTDGGVNWAPLSATVTGDVSRFGSPFQYVYKLAINRENTAEDELYAATIGGIIRSANGGETWQTVLGVNLLDEPDGTDLNSVTIPFFTEISITSDGVKYAAIGTVSNANNSWPRAGLFRSSDGVTWDDITPTGFPVQYRRIVIAPTPSNPRVLYFLVDGTPVNLWRATLLPASGNYIWENLSANIPDFGGRVGEFDSQNGYNMLLEVHPANENIVFVGGTNLYRSTDGFRSSENTAWIGGYSTENNARQYPNHHADQHVLTFFSDPDRMLSGHDGGVSVTNDGLAEEVSWTSLNNGYITSQFFTIDIPRFEYSDLMVGGMQDNGTYLRSAPGENPPWNQVFSGDGSYAQTTSDGTFWYVSAQQGQIYRLTFDSKFSLTGFARVDPAGGGTDVDNGYLFVNPFRLDPVNNNVMFLPGGNVLWRNQNLSQITNGSQEKTSVNWEKLEASRIPEGQITTLDFSVTGERMVLYGNSTGRLFKLTKIAESEVSMEEITDPSFPAGFMSSISIDPSDASRILVTFSNFGIPSVFLSTDGGSSFSDVSGNLEENEDGSGSGPSVRWGQLIPLKGGEMMAIAGTGSGLYVTDQLKTDNTTDWVRESEDVIGFSVVPMLSYNPLDGRVAIATHGNGVFETFLSDIEVVEKPSNEERFSVGAPYPNPFATKVMIPMEIPSTQIVKAVVYNAAGQPIKTLVWGTQFEGPASLSWDGTNVTGTRAAEGIYFCRVLLESGGEKTVRLIFTP